eukprot:118578-Chlamydomonas_euryale.AAC.10
MVAILQALQQAVAVTGNVAGQLTVQLQAPAETPDEAFLNLLWRPHSNRLLVTLLSLHHDQTSTLKAQHIQKSPCRYPHMKLQQTADRLAYRMPEARAARFSIFRAVLRSMPSAICRSRTMVSSCAICLRTCLFLFAFGTCGTRSNAHCMGSQARSKL